MLSRDKSQHIESFVAPLSAGLENFGNTCYCNSVLQALYSCRPFRERVLQYGSSLPRDSEENLMTCLVELFTQVWPGYDAMPDGWHSRDVAQHRHQRHSHLANARTDPDVQKKDRRHTT